MPRVLVIDDSRPARLIVTKEMKELGLDVEEAEDGQQALAKLEQLPCDLIILDVTMPVMDGPTMLAKLRAQGNNTRVIMLTSESKRATVAQAMKLGIDDYVLKPFQPGELRKKVRASLKLPAGPAAPAAGESPAPASQPVADKQAIDVVVVDDMENVAKRLRALLPQNVTLSSYTNAKDALLAFRELTCRLVLVDTNLPDVNNSALAGQIRVLQPAASLVALTLKSTNNLSEELKAQGFPEVLYKPFTPEGIEDFVTRHFDNKALLTRDDNLIKVAPFTGKADRMELYFAQLGTLFPSAIEEVASACFENAILDLSEVSFHPGRIPKLMVRVAKQAEEFGLLVRMVGSPELKKLLAAFEETRGIPMFSSVNEARAPAA